jgi:hypothetical protein
MRVDDGKFLLKRRGRVENSKRHRVCSFSSNMELNDLSVSFLGNLLLVWTLELLSSMPFYAFLSYLARVVC